MKTIGLLGGMSWESTLEYYRLINQGVKARLGGLHSARIALLSLDFAEIEALQRADDWPTLGARLAEAARQIEAAGAECLLIGTNTMHRVAEEVQAAIGIPLLHIADATAERLVEREIRSVGLLGTAFTMEQDFYKGRLAERFGLEVLVPDRMDRDTVHRVIYQELCRGELNEASRAEYLRIIAVLAERGAEAVILGCTEIGLLVAQDDTPVPLIDTTIVHAEAAVAWALDEVTSLG